MPREFGKRHDLRTFANSRYGWSRRAGRRSLYRRSRSPGQSDFQDAFQLRSPPRSSGRGWRNCGGEKCPSSSRLMRTRMLWLNSPVTPGAVVICRQKNAEILLQIDADDGRALRTDLPAHPLQQRPGILGVEIANGGPGKEGHAPAVRQRGPMASENSEVKSATTGFTLRFVKRCRGALRRQFGGIRAQCRWEYRSGDDPVARPRSPS